jgi:biopolymer transport protein ExbD
VVRRKEELAALRGRLREDLPREVDAIRLDEAIKRSDQVVILGDEAVDYGSVMEIARLVLNAGFEVSFATKVETP